jgi:hypothetical protein
MREHGKGSSVATKIASIKTVGEGTTFSVETDLVAPYNYIWKRNGVPIPGAQSAKTYTTPPARPEDFRAKYSVMVIGQDTSEESNALALDEKMPDSVTIPNQGLPKPAWQPYVEAKGKI